MARNQTECIFADTFLLHCWLFGAGFLQYQCDLQCTNLLVITWHWCDDKRINSFIGQEEDTELREFIIDENSATLGIEGIVVSCKEKE